MATPKDAVLSPSAAGEPPIERAGVRRGDRLWNVGERECVVEAHDICKAFTDGRQTVAVLHGISIQVRRGEIVALEGPSGSGKSTLLCILGCILRPTSGRVSIEGREVHAEAERDLAVIRRTHVGFVFQQFNLFPSLTARENVEYALNVKCWTGRTARDEAERALDAVGLSERKEFLPRDLSGGQKQRVAVARAIAGRSPLLLADEPTANLDSHAGTQVLEMFRRQVKRDGSALLIVTHDPSVRTIADRVLHIRDGRLVS